MKPKENKFQSQLKKELKQRFEGCVVLKNDANDIQGIPDLLILYKDKWAALECKRDAGSSHQPNQDYWINHLDSLSFARVIYPENKEEVLDELEQAFRPHWTTRIP